LSVLVATAQIVLPALVSATVLLVVLQMRPAHVVRTPRSPVARRPAAELAVLVRPLSLPARLLAAQRTARAAVSALEDDLPDVVDLLAVAAASGCNVRLAVETAAANSDGPAARLLQSALRGVTAGERLSEALAAVVGRLPEAEADAFRPLEAVLVDSDHYGTPLGPSLQRLSDDLTVHRQRRAEARARRIPVRLLLPLVLCVLPAFALLTVAPLFAGMARDALADSPSFRSDSEGSP